MKHTHLTDDELVALCVPQPTLLDVGCEACERRRTELAALLDEISDEATAAADAAFPPDRLARQYSRILQRLEQHGRLGRVITFPLGEAKRASLLRPRVARRWVAGAAAAGLIIGLAAGHLAHEIPALTRPAAVQPTTFARVQSIPLGMAGTASDDEFLREVEMAVGSSGPAALRRLESLTPVAWAVP
jgi:hypothetical protein